MKKYLTVHPWKLIESGFHPDQNRITESLFSLGNGRFGQRGCFEESYSGPTLRGNYIAGVYYPDKTRVGWWKNGYPDSFAKVLNAIDWSSLHLAMEGEEVDLARGTVESFTRELDMQHGILSRRSDVRLINGDRLRLESERFCHRSEPDLACLDYNITILDGSGALSIGLFLDLDVVNQDANWDEKFWEDGETSMEGRTAAVSGYTRKTRFRAAAAMTCQVWVNGEELDVDPYRISRDKYVEFQYEFQVSAGDRVRVRKIVAQGSSLNFEEGLLPQAMMSRSEAGARVGYETLKQAHEVAWADKWAEADITIDGDPEAQQAMRFNIFQLHQTYTGDDDRLNIGPKGFTGEKYGGSTYWDTEAYCLPFYLATAPAQVARQLLLYRYRQLPQAIDNGKKLGFTDGAALYPMVTMNGEECHNEWEITFEEIHRNGAIAYAIHDYVRYTGDWGVVPEFGIEVLIAICRFWVQRVHWSGPKQRYVMHGVTGPNEYENNVNNNWYTLYIARWCIRYTLDAIDRIKTEHPDRWAHLTSALPFYEHTETAQWREVITHLYLPEDPELGIFLQQEGYLDKELLTVGEIPAGERPIHEHWSWDRILRSCFIKQADVLQGLYFFEEDFSDEQVRRNYLFYEPRTVHESSLSPCVHAILACRLGNAEDAYRMLMRTARLDLEDINNDTRDGCHITSMAGTWMAMVRGFGGMRVAGGVVGFNPHLPQAWTGYQFRVRFRDRVIRISVDRTAVEVRLLDGEPVDVRCFQQTFRLEEALTWEWPSAEGQHAS